MDNAEEILQSLEEFTKLKPKDIPKELEEYLGYVAKTGDPVYQWHLVKYLFHEKLSNVITEFYESSPTHDLPHLPNVDPFNYDNMKTGLLERLDTFTSAPFTVQRICELLTNPRKQYNRVDKFMRAIEKNILVVSTREPGTCKRLESENETMLNGIPDNKILNESDERISNICSDNLQFNNGKTEVSQIPVENAVSNACVIQEEIEIANNASSATVTSNDTKMWTNINDENTERDLENKSTIKTENTVIDVNNTDISVVSTTSTTTVNIGGEGGSSSNSITSELTQKSDILFIDSSERNNVVKSDVIEENTNDAGQNNDNICNEPIASTNPGSPDSINTTNSTNILPVNSESNVNSTKSSRASAENICISYTSSIVTENSKVEDVNEETNGDFSLSKEIESGKRNIESDEVSEDINYNEHHPKKRIHLEIDSTEANPETSSSSNVTESSTTVTFSEIHPEEIEHINKSDEKHSEESDDHDQESLLQKNKQSEALETSKFEQTVLSDESIQQPDSSNDSCKDVIASESFTCELTSNVEVAEDSMCDIKKDCSEVNEKSDELSSTHSSEVSNVTSTIVTEAQEEEECVKGVTEEITAKEINETDVPNSSEESEEIKQAVEITYDAEESRSNDEIISESNVTETQISNEECVSIEEITSDSTESDLKYTEAEVKEVNLSSGDKNTSPIINSASSGSNSNEILVDSSSNEIMDEIGESEQVIRKEGSVIHETQVSTTDIPLVIVSQNIVETSQEIIEDIAVDRSSCNMMNEEEEAMDVDETSNQQMMVTSEGENENGEPMDQSSSDQMMSES